VKHNHDALTHSHEGGEKLHWHEPPAKSLPTRLDIVEAKLAAIEARHAELDTLIGKALRLAAQNPIGRKMIERLSKEGVTL
jgi:hypothetical protein